MKNSLCYHWSKVGFMMEVEYGRGVEEKGEQGKHRRMVYEYMVLANFSLQSCCYPIDISNAFR